MKPEINKLETGTVADPRLIFVAALKANACSIIISHNHPGNLNPSEQDKELTSKIKQAGMLVDIKVLDHLIITKETYYLLADEGIL